MPKKLEDIGLRSEDVQEILTEMPHWMIRWGITSVLIIIVIVLALSWFIKYPDTIGGTATLTTEIPPITLVSKTDGQLQKLNYQNGDKVKKGAFLAEIENPLSETTVQYLKEIVNQVYQLLEDGGVDIAFTDDTLIFGNIQNDYNELQTDVKNYLFLTADSHQAIRERSLQEQIENHKKLKAIAETQYALAKEILEGSTKQFEATKRLYEENVMPALEYYDKEAALNRERQQVEDFNKSIIQYQISIADYQKQLQELVFDFSERKRVLKTDILNDIRNIQNRLASWKKSHVLTAPFDGELNFLSNLAKNQFVPKGTPLFAVASFNRDFVAYVSLPPQGFGKVKIGQRAYIKLDSYPDHQYGRIVGKVAGLTRIPNRSDNMEGNYIAKVSLENGLHSTFNKELSFQPEMSGVAEIVTNDYRLMERIFYRFRGVLDK